MDGLRLGWIIEMKENDLFLAIPFKKIDIVQIKKIINIDHFKKAIGLDEKIFRCIVSIKKYV